MDGKLLEAGRLVEETRLAIRLLAKDCGKLDAPLNIGLDTLADKLLRAGNLLQGCCADSDGLRSFRSGVGRAEVGLAPQNRRDTAKRENAP